jgi:hypothetical protein
MYRDDNFLLPETKEFGEFHELAELLRKGCLLRPRKLRGLFQRGERWACALGAIGVAAEMQKIGETSLKKRFPQLKNQVVDPDERCWASLFDVIASLNDGREISRESIADWLCQYGGCTHWFADSGIKIFRALRRRKAKEEVVVETWFEDAPDSIYGDAA